LIYALHGLLSKNQGTVAYTSSRPTPLTICIPSSYAAAILISWWEPTANINETRTWTREWSSPLYAKYGLRFIYCLL